MVTEATPKCSQLLLRDVPLPYNYTDGEIQLVVWLSRWRNLGHKMPKLVESQRDITSPSIFSNTSSVVIPNQFLADDNLESWFSRDTEELFLTIVRRIIDTVVDSLGEIQPTFLNLLRLYFESILLGNDFNIDHTVCLWTPLRYRDFLSKTSREKQSIHEAFTLLLARNLKYYSSDDKARRVKEVITMLWACPVDRGHLGTGNLVRKLGLEEFFDANKTQMVSWIKNADEISNVAEILEHLAIAQTDQPDIGPLWRVMAPSTDADPHSIEAIEAFRWILQSVSPARHQALIHLLCRDIELGPLETFTNHLTIGRLDGIYLPQDSCLKFLVQYIKWMGKGSSNIPLVEIEDQWKESWFRIATHIMGLDAGANSNLVLPLQAALWPALPDNGRAMFERALMEPKTLVRSLYIVSAVPLTSLKSHLERIFEYPIECSDHCDTEGHVLLHILSTMTNFTFPTSYPAFKAVPLEGRYVDAVAALLILSDESEEIPQLNLGRTVDEKCLELIRGIFKRATESQFGILALLYGICARILDYGGISTEEVALVSICVFKLLKLPRDHRSIPIIRPVIGRIMRIRAALGPSRGIEETEAVSIVGLRCVDRLHTHLATMVIFGGQNCRALSCARTREIFAPAVGWLAEYAG